MDIHLHTRRHSGCSRLDERRLIRRAIERGLDGLVITEHHYQWSEAELAALLAEAEAPGFALMAAFEYSSAKGDILMYGLRSDQVRHFPPGGDPEAMLARARDLGAVCVAAHPTRAAIPFDDRILGMPFDAIEVRSVNLAPHEQRIASRLAQDLGILPVAASDAHRLEDVGAHVTEFDAPIRCMADLLDTIRRGLFRPADILLQRG